MTTHIHLCGILAAMLTGPFAGVAVAQDSPAGEEPKSEKNPAALIAAIPPQEREDIAFARKLAGNLAPETTAKLKWGEPVNGLRMALGFPPALKDPLLGDEPYFQLVVQNVSKNAVHFSTGDDAPNPRSMRWREGERIVQSLSDKDAHKADWNLAPGECGALRMFTKEEPGKDGKTISALLDGDLAGGPRYHVVCIMEVAKAPAGAWTGKLVTGQTRGSADKADAPAPQHKDARALYEIWQHHARINGDIPGALVGDLAAAVKVFIGYNPTWETVPKLNKILPRLDATRDWKPADAIALLNELAAVQDSPLQTAAEKTASATIRKGEALQEKFASVVWGKPQPNGLRAAWVLEPAAAEHRIGTALKARLLVQNNGGVPVMARVPTWHQGNVSARDSGGAEIEVSGISWTTMAQLVPFRFAPGEFIEINAPGVGLGPLAGAGPWAGPRVGSNVLEKDGVELTLTHGPVPLDGSGVGMREDAPHLIGAGWWLAHIKARLARELPLPADAAERTHLLDRAVRELFTVAPTAEEIAAFTADQTPGALDALAKRLAERPDVVEFAGSLPTAPVNFRVLPADPAADKTPRVALGPGEYPLGKGAKLKMVGRPDGERYIYDTKILFDDAESHKIEIPGDWGTWAIVCRPGEGFFYVLHQGVARKIDYNDPAKVTDAPATDLPAEFRAEVKRQLDIAGVPAESQAEVFEKPAPPAAPPAPKTAQASPRPEEAALKPNHEYAQALFKKWQAGARTDGKIPGGLIGQVARTTDDAVKQITDADVSAKLAALRPRLEVSRDWTQAEAVALLDDITAIATAPASWADTAMEFSSMRAVRQGEPLPVELASAAWGAPAENGLRAAWLLEPRAEQYTLGTVLKARVLFHNAGKAPVVFETETWHQDDKHTARDAKGAELPVKATWFTGITPMSKFRLAPGEYCEVSGHGIAIGAGEYNEEFSTGAAGAIIEAREGDTVTLSHSVDAGTGGWTRPNDLWLVTIAGRVANEAPMPASTADREQLIRRVTLDILGTAPTAAEIAAFTADNSPDALAKLTARLQTHPRIEPFAGKLPTGETKFRVIAADPNAAKSPRTATAPGRYVLGDGVHLQVRQVTEGGQRTNSAEIIFFGPDPKKESPHKPYQIAFYVPDSAYAFVWQRGANKLWVTEISEGEPIRPWLLGSPEQPGPQKVTLRAFDFSNPADVQLTHVSCSENGGDWSWGKIVPAAFHQPVLDALGARGKRLRDFIEPQKEMPAGASAPQLPKLPDDAYAKPGMHCQKFHEEEAKRPGGERIGFVLEPSKPADLNKEPLVLGVRTASDAQWRIGGTARVGLVVRNRSRSDVKFSYNGRLENGLSIVAVDEAGKAHEAVIAHFDSELTFQQMLLPRAHMATLKEFTLRFDPEKRGVTEPQVPAFHLPPGKYTLRCKWNDARSDVAHEGEWTGELLNEELEFTLAATAEPAEKPKDEAAPGAGVPEKPPQSVAVDVEKDGSLSWNRKAVTMAELKAEAAREPKRRVVIRADKDVPYAKVVEVVETFKAAGVTEMSFREARVGDGRYRVANVTGSYDFDGKHRFSICQPLGREQWFTVSWPAKDGQPLRLLRLFPNAPSGKHGHWAVVWEPGTEVLWWVDESDVGKMSVADPAAVVVERESRSGAFSREFALPDGVAAEFRRLGHEVGGGSGEAKRTREVLKAEPPGKTKTAEAHEAGMLKLELYGRQQGQQEPMLTRDAKPEPVNAPEKHGRPGNARCGAG